MVQHMTLAERSLPAVVSFVDRLVPKRAAVVVRTSTTSDDQGREVLRALARVGVDEVTWLVSDDASPVGREFDDLGLCAPVVAVSAAGLAAYWRARVVVHTHGVFGSRSGARAKQFVNVWHGMPIKRLEPASLVGRHQSDLTIATAPVHAEHLAETWHLPLHRVVVTGLPRNDVLVDPDRVRPEAIEQVAHGRPLVVWLPTFRRQTGVGGRVDGVDIAEPSQLEGGDGETANEMFARLGVHAVLKAHPLAPAPNQASYSHLDVWSDADLGRHALTLYELLASADYLVTDHSSVWVDFLLTGRPMVFAISDLSEYRTSRGFYFDDIEALLPGPLVTDLSGLEGALTELRKGGDAWEDLRAKSLDLHHVYRDAGSADRVANLVRNLLDPQPPRSGERAR